MAADTTWLAYRLRNLDQREFGYDWGDPSPSLLDRFATRGWHVKVMDGCKPWVYMIPGCVGRKWQRFDGGFYVRGPVLQNLLSFATHLANIRPWE